MRSLCCVSSQKGFYRRGAGALVSACQPSTVCLFQVHWKGTRFTLRPVAAILFTHFLYLFSMAISQRDRSAANQLFQAVQPGTGRQSRLSQLQKQGAAHYSTGWTGLLLGDRECQTINESSPVNRHPCQWDRGWLLLQ